MSIVASVMQVIIYDCRAELIRYYTTYTYWFLDLFHNYEFHKMGTRIIYDGLQMVNVMAKM